MGDRALVTSKPPLETSLPSILTINLAPTKLTLLPWTTIRIVSPILMVFICSAVAAVAAPLMKTLVLTQAGATPPLELDELDDELPDPPDELDEPPPPLELLLEPPLPAHDP